MEASKRVGLGTSGVSGSLEVEKGAPVALRGFGTQNLFNCVKIPVNSYNTLHSQSTARFQSSLQHVLGIRVQRRLPVASFTRRKQEFTPTEKKDASYWTKRRKNNEAAKRSRAKKCFNDLMLERRLMAMKEENLHLKTELMALKLRCGQVKNPISSQRHVFYSSSLPHLMPNFWHFKMGQIRAPRAHSMPLNPGQEQDLLTKTSMGLIFSEGDQPPPPSGLCSGKACVPEEKQGPGHEESMTCKGCPLESERTKRQGSGIRVRPDAAASAQDLFSTSCSMGLQSLPYRLQLKYIGNEDQEPLNQRGHVQMASTQALRQELRVDSAPYRPVIPSLSSSQANASSSLIPTAGHWWRKKCSAWRAPSGPPMGSPAPGSFSPFDFPFNSMSYQIGAEHL
ncbi:uncharacterized protein LOC117869089 [Trachemys scripta elegans]|uniref:uncharacterized protein LOC117869089 n=1 Tax=Trachemys scripta elegans TaxID=31138 RepID=UPI00155560E6|nr:uncharacterized protein LOC117869089 [Trachemys scripta elegans]